jgi:putative transposase
MIDESLGKALAFHLAFEPPSTASCLSVLRECAKRHGVLPGCITLDGGKEFRSVGLEMLMARYGVIVEIRPPTKPRFGSVIERLFSKLGTQLLYQLVGNNLRTKNPRTVAIANDPRGQALWTLRELQDALELYLYWGYEAGHDAAISRAQAEAFAKGMQKGDERAGREINDYDAFVISTLPTTPSGEAKVQPRRGVRIKYIDYWCDEFRNPKIEGTKVAVRYDPYDIGTAYAWVDDRWVICRSIYHRNLKDLSAKEIRIASKEIRRLKALEPKEKLERAEQLKQFLAKLRMRG